VISIYWFIQHVAPHHSGGGCSTMRARLTVNPKAAFIAGDSASRGNLAQRWIFPRATKLCRAGGPVGAQQCL
jgi:hypothetical protein